MLLAVDIGNTNIVMGLFKGKRIIRHARFDTHIAKSRIYRRLSSLLQATDIETAVISSVVPNATAVVEDIIRERFGIKVFVLGKNMKVPIKNLYHKPKQVGQDRLVNAYACLKIYGKPAIIVDFGTATTIDYIDKNGAYRGGLITPGAEITIEALYSRTALLPKIKLKKPKSLIGKDTVESIRSGLSYGLASMCDGIIAMLKKKSGEKTIVVATGGLASYFAPYCKEIGYIDKDLILKGLYYIFKNSS